MPDRSIVVRLRADISDLKAKMAEAGSATGSVGAAAERASKSSAKAFGQQESAAQKFANAEKLRAAVRKSAADDEVRANERQALTAGKYGKTTAAILQNKQSLTTLGNGFTVLGLAAAAGVGVAVNAAANFDQAMSGVAASGQDAKNSLGALRDAAIQAGAATKYSATEAAAGEEALAKAGVSAKDILGGGLSGALNLAAAGNLGVADSAEVAASAMTQFGLSGAQVPHIADLLAAGAGKAQGEVSDLAAALGQSGLIASQTGLSIEETTGSLAAFASAGLVGSDAGTAFKTMLQSLTPNSAQAAAAMKRIGLEAYDAQGNFIGITAVADQLKTGLSKLSVEQQNATLKTIFGSDAVRAASIIYKDGGAGIQSWIDNVNDSGFAAETAATKMDNLKGDLEQFQGSLETALIGVGEGGTGPLRQLVQEATSAVNAFNDLGDGTKGAVLAIGGIGAAALLGVGGVLKLATAASTGVTAIRDLASAAPRGAAALGALGKAAGVATVALVGLQALGAAQSNQIDKIALSSKQAGTALAGLAQGGHVAADTFGQSFSGVIEGVDGVGDALNLLNGNTGFLQTAGTKFFDFTSAIAGAQGPTDILAQNFKTLDTQLTTMPLDQARLAFNKLSEGLNNEQIAELLKQLPQYADAARNAGSAAKGAGTAAAAASSGLDATSASADDAGEALTKMVDAAQAAANTMLQLSGSEIGVESAIDAATAAAKKNGDTLNLNSAKGRENQQALNSLAAATGEYTKGLIESGRSAADVVAANERGRQSYIDTAVSMGKSRKSATELASTLFALPRDVTSQVVVSGAKVSKKQADDLNEAIQKLPKEQRARIVTIAETKGAKAARQAMAEVKDKQVIAKSKQAGTGAKDVKKAMDALKDRLVEAKSRGDKSGAQKVAEAMRALKDRQVVARVKADTSGVGTVRSALATVGDKVVHVKIVRTGSTDATSATGGLITHAGVLYRGPLKRSTGGPVWGEGTATSDSIPAMLSDGEFVQNADATSYYGAGFMAALNRKQVPRDAVSAMGYAGGGLVGYASGGSVDIPRIERLIRALLDPFTDIRAASRSVSKETRDVAKERRDLTAAREDRKDADSKKERRKADAAVTKQAGQLKDQLRELHDAQKTSKEALQAFADQARQAGQTLAEPYQSKSVDVDDIKEAKRQGTADLKAFAKQIAQLRRLGLNETDVQDIVSKGAVNGGEEAQQIIDGGKKAAAAMNRLTRNFELAADAIGLLVSRKPKRRAYGGLLEGDGSDRSDNISLLASPGEFVTDAPSTRRNLGLLQHINAGKDPRHLIPSWSVAGMGPQQVSRSVRGGDTIVTGNQIGVDADQLARKIARKQMDSLVRVGLR